MEIRSATKHVLRELRYESLATSEPFLVAEIGVRDGNHALGMQALLQPTDFILVDHYRPYQDGRHYRSAEEQGQYLKEIAPLLHANPNMALLRLESEDAAEHYQDRIFDFVYIDARHDYEFVSRDISCWLPKVKNGGFLGGHDFFWDESNAGVVRAVSELGIGPITIYPDTDWIVRIP